MVSPTVALPIQPEGRLFTAADLAVLPTHLPSGDVDYELDRGRLIIMVPPGHEHGATQLQIGTELMLQGQRKGHGRAYTEIGVVLSRNPDSVVGPDAAFVVASRLPVRESREGYLETIPDLVVEVRSKNDSLAELTQKISDYLAAGVRIVWVADSTAKTIVAHAADSPPRTYRASDTLSAGEVIPGFQLNVAEIFQK
jgi:Uma2 family endonuclease